jgi:hypothetical protein
MGIFHQQVCIVNRTPIALNVRFDGQDMPLEVGESFIPAVAVPYAKNQNPIMGSQDPTNPSLSGARYLIGVKVKKGERQHDPIELLTKLEWDAHCAAVCRMDWQTLMEDTIKPGEKVVVKGKKGSVQARSSYDSGVRVHAPGLENEAV